MTENWRFSRWFFEPVFCAFVALVVYSASADASSVQIEFTRTPEVRLLLRSSQCAPLLAENKALCNWKRKLDRVANSPEPAPKAGCEKRGDEFALDVTACVPSAVLARQETCSLEDGPNCWGSALYLSGMLSAPLEADHSEIEYWSRSSFCRKLKRNEKTEPGDLISIQGDGGQEASSPYDSEVHSFIAVGPALSFEKAGMSKAGAYHFKATDEILDHWKVTTECRNRGDIEMFNYTMPLLQEIDRKNGERAALDQKEARLRKAFFEEGRSESDWESHRAKNREWIALTKKREALGRKIAALYAKRDRYLTEPDARPCRRWSVRYRCDSALAYLQSRQLGALPEIVSQLKQIECAVQKRYFENVNALDREQLRILRDSLAILKKLIGDELESMGDTKHYAKEVAALKGLQLRVEQLFRSL